MAHSNSDTLYFGNLKYNEIISISNKYHENQSNSTLKIGILRNITVDNYIPLLKYLLHAAHFNVDLRQGEYDVIMQEVLDPGMPMITFTPDVLIVFLNIRNLSPNIYYKYTSLSAEEIIIEK